MSYPFRLARALRDNWRRILLGFATGLYVAFGVSLGLVLVSVTHGERWNEVTLALVLDAILLVGMLGGAVVGYATRRRPVES